MKEFMVSIIVVLLIAVNVLSEYRKWEAQETFRAEMREFMLEGPRFTATEAYEMCVAFKQLDANAAAGIDCDKYNPDKDR